MLDRVKERFARLRRGERAEEGNALIIILMMFPVILGAVGLAVDTSVAQSSNSNFQSALDAAAQSALSRAVNPGVDGNTSFIPRVVEATARENVIAFYGNNRNSTGDTSGLIVCQEGGNEGRLVTPADGCSWTERDYSLTVDGNDVQLDMTVYEETNPVFLHMIGIGSIKYEISTSARTTYSIG